MRFNDAFDLLERVQASKAKNTVAQTKSILAHLRPFFGDKSLAEFERDYEEIWSEYITYIGGRHKLAHDRRYLTMALKRARIKGWITKTFIKSDFQLKEAHQPIGRALEDDEVKRIMFEAAKYPRFYLQMLMALTMGMRRSEILQLRRDEIDSVKRVLNLDANRLKTRQPRKVPIPISDQVWPLLEARLYNISYIFPSQVRGVINTDKPQRDMSYHWNKVRAASGVQCRFHDLRHTCVSMHLAAGMTISDAVKIFGATSQVLERIYHHVRQDASDAFRSRLKLPIGMYTDE